jgi:hypothetical protein
MNEYENRPAGRVFHSKSNSDDVRDERERNST